MACAASQLLAHQKFPMEQKTVELDRSLSLMLQRKHENAPLTCIECLCTSMCSPCLGGSLRTTNMQGVNVPLCMKSSSRIFRIFASVSRVGEEESEAKRGEPSYVETDREGGRVFRAGEAGWGKQGLAGCQWRVVGCFFFLEAEIPTEAL